VFEKSSCDFVFTGRDAFCDRCGETISRRIPEAEGDPLELFCQGRFYGNTLLTAWHRTLAKKIGAWDEYLIVNQDHDYINHIIYSYMEKEQCFRIS